MVIDSWCSVFCRDWNKKTPGLVCTSNCIQVWGIFLGVWPEKTRFARLSDNRALSVAKPHVYFISTNHFLHIATPEKKEQYDHLRSTWINSPKIIVMICFCLSPTQPWFLDVSAGCSWYFYCWWLGPIPCGDSISGETEDASRRGFWRISGWKKWNLTGHSCLKGLPFTVTLSLEYGLSY